MLQHSHYNFSFASNSCGLGTLGQDRHSDVPTRSNVQKSGLTVSATRSKGRSMSVGMMNKGHTRMNMQPSPWQSSTAGHNKIRRSKAVPLYIIGLVRCPLSSHNDPPCLEEISSWISSCVLIVQQPDTKSSITKPTTSFIGTFPKKVSGTARISCLSSETYD